ncbi:hypothetical protein [Weissella fangxianensis]|uniref:hypothetical protein n=1 Tax=Weissella fangxianensis TaxID=2953879 RepID=UPI0021576811|nr:hypothetical protein [Weissella fangxianensis]
MLTEQIEDACIYFIVIVLALVVSVTIMADKSLFAQIMLMLGTITGTVMLVRQWRNN